TLLTRRHPGAAPFPYTTLCRSGVAGAGGDHGAAEAARAAVEHPAAGGQVIGKAVVHDVAGAEAGGEERALEAPEAGACRLEFVRSEEHTSELQSRENLVCRLLL